LPSSRTAKILAGASLIAVAAIAGYWYLSPYLVIRQMQAAAQARDAEAFNARVDYPKVRASVKEQFANSLSDKLGKSDDSGTGLAILGSAIGMALVNPLVDAFVDPNTVMRAMRDGQMIPKGRPPRGDSSQPPSQPANQGSADPKEDQPRWSCERQGPNRLVAYAADPGKPEQKPSNQLGLVFQRKGFSDWKLTEVRIPALNK
jgi:hypothetical protein